MDSIALEISLALNSRRLRFAVGVVTDRNAPSALDLGAELQDRSNLTVSLSGKKLKTLESYKFSYSGSRKPNCIHLFSFKFHYSTITLFYYSTISLLNATKRRRFSGKPGEFSMENFRWKHTFDCKRKDHLIFYGKSPL